MPDTNDFIVDHQPFLAERLSEGPAGYTWTLASRLGQMLKEAEAQFGPQDSAYTFVGIEFAPEGPRLSFPNSDRHVIVQLSLNSLDNIQTMCFELAHQSVGLLSPIRDGSRTVLSEGLATQFAVTYMREHFHAEWNTDRDASLEAQSLVADLLEFSPDLIKTLRETQPILSKITSDLILANYPEIPGDIAEAVTAPVTDQAMISVASDIQFVPMRPSKVSEAMPSSDQSELVLQLREENTRLSAALERSQMHVGQALEALAAEQRRIVPVEDVPKPQPVTSSTRLKMSDFISEEHPEAVAVVKSPVRKRSAILDSQPASISAKWKPMGLDMSSSPSPSNPQKATELDKVPDDIVPSASLSAAITDTQGNESARDGDISSDEVEHEVPAKPASRVWKWLMGENVDPDYS